MVIGRNDDQLTTNRKAVEGRRRRLNKSEEGVGSPTGLNIRQRHSGSHNNMIPYGIIQNPGTKQ